MGGDIGSLPGTSIATELGFGVTRGRFSLRPSFRYSPQQRTAIAHQADAWMDFSQFTGDLRACFAQPVTTFELGGCLGGELGVLQGEGIGVSTSKTADALSGAVLVGSQIGWNLGRRVWLVSRAEVGAALSRPTFFVENIGDVYRPAALFGRLALSVDYRF